MAKTLTKSATWELIHQQRARVAELLGGLDDEGWRRPSLCVGWTVRDVAAHCVETHLMTPPRFMLEFATTGFRFNAMTGRGVHRHADQPLEALLSAYRQSMGRTTAPPGPLVAMLAEAVIHGEDMARPGGARLDTSEASLVEVANFVRRTSALLHGKQRSAGLHLRATDVNWSAGSGPEVSGPAGSLILAMTGRTSALSELSGGGMPALSARMA